MERESKKIKLEIIYLLRLKCFLLQICFIYQIKKKPRQANVQRIKNMNYTDRIENEMFLDKRAKRKKASWFYLITNGPIDGKRERTDIASSQVVLLPLVAEQLQLSLLLLIQHVTITHLNNADSHQNNAPVVRKNNLWLPVVRKNNWKS